MDKRKYMEKKILRGNKLKYSLTISVFVTTRGQHSSMNIHHFTLLHLLF